MLENMQSHPLRFEKMLSNINDHLSFLLKGKKLASKNIKTQIQKKIDRGIFPQDYMLDAIHTQEIYERDIENLLEAATVHFNQLRSDYCKMHNITRINNKRSFDQLQKIQFQKLVQLEQILESDYKKGFFQFSDGNKSSSNGFSLFGCCGGVQQTSQQKAQKAQKMSLYLNNMIDQSKQKQKQIHEKNEQEDSLKNMTKIDKEIIKKTEKQKDANFFRKIWDKTKKKQDKVHSIEQIDLTGNIQEKANKYVNFSKLYSVMHLLQMSKIDKQILDKVPKSPYKDNLIQAIKTTIHDVNPQSAQDRHFMDLREPIVKELQQLRDKVQNSVDGLEDYYYDHQCWQIILIIIFKHLTRTDYNAYRRRIIRNVYNRFATAIDYEIEVLRILENLTFNSQWHPVRFYSKSEDKEFKAYQKEQIQSIHNKLASEDPQFTKGNADNNFPINFSLTKLTDIQSRRRVVTILISGFLSQDNDKNFEWGGMIDTMKDSEVYALEWKSTTIGGMMKFLGSASIQILGAQGKGGLYGKAMSVANSFRSKFNQNPFTDAFQVADRTGKYLGQLICRLFPGQFINLLGYSLGTQLILSTMKQIRKNNMDLMMNKIIMLGGVTDVSQLDKVAKDFRSPIEVINCFTEHDTVLKYLLKACMPDIKPIGLNELPDHTFEGHVLTDKDCKDFIGGHLLYMANWKVLGRFLQMKDQ